MRPSGAEASMAPDAAPHGGRDVGDGVLDEGEVGAVQGCSSVPRKEVVVVARYTPAPMRRIWRLRRLHGSACLGTAATSATAVTIASGSKVHVCVSVAFVLPQFVFVCAGRRHRQRPFR
uniref:Uncharacterized protein n=1 Tax=Arundo donax TaxID=35708 RepID=A0A0A9F2A2_ARUDO